MVVTQSDEADHQHPATPAATKSAAPSNPETMTAPGHTDPGIPMSLKALGTVVGSTTALTALLFYFGWSRAYYFYDYFGVDSSVLSLTTQDYIQLSVDGLFVPLAIAACGGLALLYVQSRLAQRIATSRRLRRLAIAAGVLGGLLMINGLSRVLGPTPFNRYLAVAPLSLALGALLFFYGMRLLRRARIETPARVSAGEWVALLTVLGVALFWLVNDYSADVGVSRARQFVSELGALPNAQLFSTKSLGLSAPGIRETRCRNPEATYAYRYDGLKLVLQSGDAYLFLPGRWTRADGIAILLPRNDTVRLEFSRAHVDPTRPC